MKLVKFSDYYELNDEQLNEGVKTWLSVFMILLQMGLVPPKIINGSPQEKMDYVQNVPKGDLDIARFITFLNQNSVKDKGQVENLFGQFKQKYNNDGNFEDVWNNINYDNKSKEFKFETKIPTENYAKWMNTVKPINHVNDYAKVINDVLEKRLNQRLIVYESKIDVEIGILTIPHLNNEVIADYTVKTGQRWGVGKKGTDNGLMIVLSKDDRKIHMSTGYGLEGVLPDATCKRLINNIFIPYAKEGKYGEGIDALLKAVAEHIGEDEHIEAKKERLAKESAETKRKVGNFFIILAQILAALGAAYLIYYLIRKRKLKLKKLEDDLNYQIKRLERMTSVIGRIDASDLTKKSEQITIIKTKLQNLSSDHDIKQSYIDELDKKLDGLSKEYNIIIRSYNDIEKSLRYIDNIDTKVIDPKYSPKIQEISDNLRNFVNKVKKSDIDIEKSSEYKGYIGQIQNVTKKFNKLKDMFDEIEIEDKRFGKFKQSLLSKISRSIKSIENIESMRYTYDNPEVSDREAERLEDMFNDVKSIYKEDIVKAYGLFALYNQSKSGISRRTGNIIDYEDYINDTKDFVYSYDIDDGIKKYLKWIKYRKFAKWKNYETIKKIEDKIPGLEELLKNPVDFLLVKSRIDELEKMSHDEYYRVKEEKEEEEEEERRRRRRREQEKEDRRRRKRQEDEARRRRNSYSSSSSGGGGSSFGGFGGGSFGGGGAGGSW